MVAEKGEIWLATWYHMVDMLTLVRLSVRLVFYIHP